MKRLGITALLLGTLAFAFSARPARAQYQGNGGVTVGGFYDELAPYGRWVNCSYGQCWVPASVNADWQPYSNGQWVYTEYGWTWMSNDPWGGNPYHYGTWTSLNGYGWSWVPGTIWAPAWVTWSYGNNYVGWAPLPPTVVFGASGYGGGAIVVAPIQYVFVPMNRFVGTSVTSVRVSAPQNAAIFRQTTPVTRFAVAGGIVRNTAIPVATIQRATNVRIETRSISAANTTPRSISAGTAGKSQQVAIVAPAREVKAAAAARPQSVSRSAAPSTEKAAKAQVNQESKSATQSRQGSQGSTAQHATVKPDHQEQMAPKAHQASPAESHGQAAQAHPQVSSKAPPPAHAQAHPSEPGPKAKAAPAKHQEPPAQANPPAHHAPAKPAQPASPKQGSGGEKSVQKDKSQEKP